MRDKLKYKYKSKLLTLSKNIHNNNTEHKINSCNKNISKYENNKINNNDNDSNEGFFLQIYQLK